MHTLKQPYLQIETMQGAAYGGNQAWFSHRFLKRSACGVISAANLLFYVQGRRVVNRQEYMAFAKTLWKQYLPVIPGLGMNGLTLVLGLNRWFRKEKMPYRACWNVSAKTMPNRIDEMLSKDLPVILAVGPNFPNVFGKNLLTFYQKDREGKYFPAAKTKAHFVTVTAREGQKLCVSSWGKEYWLDRMELRAYVRSYSSPLVSNIIYIKKKGI